jgi:hypothetical protein
MTVTPEVHESADLIAPHPAPTQRTGGLIAAILALFGFRAGIRPIADNSMLLHLRTGITIAATGHIPTRDPYSFTAHLHPWVVESWLAELSYGLAYRVGGLHLVVLEQGVLMAALALVVAGLGRVDGTARMIVAAGLPVFAGVALWSQRPLLFGLLGLGLLVLVVLRRWSPWWLLPIGWVWVNTHGSFPLGGLWLVAAYLGSMLDTRSRPRWLEPYVIAFTGSIALGAINPIGPRLVAFPLEVESKRRIFQTIVEWKSPDFQSTAPLFALVFIAVGMVVAFRSRTPFLYAAPFVAFLVLGLISARNLAAACVLLAPLLAAALQPSAADTVGERGDGRSAPDARAGRDPLLRVFAIVLAVVAVVFAVDVYKSPGLYLKSYPTAAEAYLIENHLILGHRIATQDFVGDYRSLIEGPNSSGVFVDDRYDMYPDQVAMDYRTLLVASAGAPAVLQKWDIDEIVWQESAGLPDLLRLTGGWRKAFSAGGFVVLVRDPTVKPSPSAPA